MLDSWSGTRLSPLSLPCRWRPAVSCVDLPKESTCQFNDLCGDYKERARTGSWLVVSVEYCVLQIGMGPLNIVRRARPVLSGNTLTLTLAMTFESAYAGAKNTYMYAADVSGSVSGWQPLGTWTIPAATGVPSPVSVTPNSGSVASQTFAFQYSDTAGAASLSLVYAWFNPTLTSAANSCFLYYQASTNQLNLLNNTATAYLSAALGSATTLQNSQCAVNAAASTVALSGNTLTLTLAMTFESAYAGAKNTYMYAADVSGSVSGWQPLGTWTIPAAANGPSAVSVTPSSGSGASQSFALQYSDTAGAASLSLVYVWFNPTLTSAANSCFLYYQASTNQLNLLNNTATAYLSAALGSATTLQNSQCAVNAAASTVALSGNTLTLTLAMTFESAYAGLKNTYMYAADVSGSVSGWQQLGTWTP